MTTSWDQKCWLLAYSRLGKTWRLCQDSGGKRALISISRQRDRDRMALRSNHWVVSRHLC